MGRGCAPPSTSIDAEGLQRFFDEKTAGVRKSTADAPPLHFLSAPPECDFSTFHTLTVDDVIATIRKLPDKQCANDPLPTRL